MGMLLNSLTHGFVMGLSLIVAIGAQNTFVLKQGLKQQHIFWVCFVCALSDAILIMVGVMGFGTILLQHPIITDIAKFAGATFLAVYGAMHFWQAWKAEQHFLIDDNQLHSLWKTISICLAFTWLNPHVYLDTVVLLGSISVQFYEWKIYFALGAMTASFMFFFALGYASRCLLPIFNNPRAWRILDIFIGFIMWWIALSLLF